MGRNGGGSSPRVWRWLFAAALSASCVDGPTDPGRFGELRFRPTYAVDDNPAALGVAIDSARVHVVRPADSGASLVDSMVAYRSDTVSLGWILGLRAREETLHVDVAIWDTSERLYSGSGTVIVRDGDVGGAATELRVAYVGPPIIATVVASPDVATIDALGATTTLTAVARDRHGVAGAAPVARSSADETVATVDPASGVVTAVANGTTTVQVAAGSARGSTAISVAQRVSTVEVTPATSTLTALGATQALSAVARDANGRNVAGAAIAWSSSDASVASVDAATGVVTAKAGGSATITAASGAAQGRAMVTVNPVATVASIVVSRRRATLMSVGATRQFTAHARDASGAELPGVQFTWASSASGVATIDPATGLATAAGHGSATITAVAGAVHGTATLNVDLSQAVASIVGSPASAPLTSLRAP